jgi:DNA-binding phage protein
VWPTFQKADVLAGIGQYAIILLGGPGEVETPLIKCGAEDLRFITAYAEDDAVVTQFENDEHNERFGLPLFYTLKRTNAHTPAAINTTVIGKKVHYTRIIHVAETLDDRTYGIPRLERVWNLLDDLEKVTGGGAEAFWKRADAGMQIAIDPTMNLEEPEIKAMKEETDDYIHGLKRVIRTRGIEMKQLGSDVANIGPSSEAIISQLSAATGIPQRILMGSEQAKLASIQDRTNWDERIESRRAEYAEPYIVRPFISRMIDLGVMPEPKEEYAVAWSQIKTMDDGEKADLANRWADINQKTGQDVVSANEIRVQCLGLSAQEETPELVSRTGGPTGKMTGASEEEAMLHVLATAIEHGNTSVIEHLTGLKLSTTPAEVESLTRELESLKAASSPKSNPDFERLIKSITALAAREMPAPKVNVTVEPPNVNVTVQGNGTQRLERDEHGLLTRIVRE